MISGKSERALFTKFTLGYFLGTNCGGGNYCKMGFVKYLSVSSWTNCTRLIFFLLLSRLRWREELLFGSIDDYSPSMLFFNILTKTLLLPYSVFLIGYALWSTFYFILLYIFSPFSFKTVIRIDSSNIFLRLWDTLNCCDNSFKLYYEDELATRMWLAVWCNLSLWGLLCWKYSYGCNLKLNFFFSLSEELSDIWLRGRS
jgi:hypothetical protein